MKILTMAALLAVIYAFLRDEKPFGAVRDFVYQYYESETDCKLDNSLDALFPALAPYLEFEEAFSDKDRRKKFQRLYHVLRLPNVRPEHMVFALNFNQIQQLNRKLESRMITKDVYDDQLKKLSPTNFNIKVVGRWANAHKSFESMDESKLT